MNLKLPDLNLYLDASGRFSENDSTPIVIAGIAIEVRKTSETQAALLTVIESPEFKWKFAYADIPKAKKVFRLMVKRQLTADVLLIRKTQPKWDEYWRAGERLYQTGVSRAQEAMQYAKPAVTLKFHLYGIAIARLTGLHLRRYRKILLSNDAKPLTIQVNAICDSDIQGEASQKVFQWIFENMGDLKQLREGANVIPTIKVDLKTEEEIPLLLLPDFLAGYNYSREAYGVGNENNWNELLTTIEPIHSQWPGHSIVSDEMSFDLDYLIPEDTFDHVIPRRDRERLLSSALEAADTDAESPN